MTDGFDRLVPDARSFLAALAANNSRDWFTANAPRYEAELKAPALAFLELMAAELHRLTDKPVTTKLFRPQRDLRFSHDKTPYHTHLHMAWSAGGFGWFFGIAPDYVSAGASVFSFDAAALAAWRDLADRRGNDIAAMIGALQDKGARLDPPALKRVPAPYDKSHAHGDLLRRKGLALWFDADMADIEKGGLTQWVTTAFSELLPVQTALRPLL